MGSELKERVKEILSSLECIDDYDPEDSFWEEAVKSYADDAINLIKDQQARIEELEAREKWRDISSAPKDNTPVLVYYKKGDYEAMYIARYDYSSACSVVYKEIYGGVYNINPTHWMPLSEAPKEVPDCKGRIEST